MDACVEKEEIIKKVTHSASKKHSKKSISIAVENEYFVQFKNATKIDECIKITLISERFIFVIFYFVLF